MVMTAGEPECGRERRADLRYATVSIYTVLVVSCLVPSAGKLALGQEVVCYDFTLFEYRSNKCGVVCRCGRSWNYVKEISDSYQ